MNSFYSFYYFLPDPDDSNANENLHAVRTGNLDQGLDSAKVEEDLQKKVDTRSVCEFMYLKIKEMKSDIIKETKELLDKQMEDMKQLLDRHMEEVKVN